MTAFTRGSTITFSTCSGFDEQRLKNAFVKTGAAKDFFDRERALRNVGRVFEQADVSGHQRRRRKTEHLPERKIPRHDGEDWSERLITNETSRRAGLRRLVFQKSFCVLGVESATARAFLDFFNGSAQELSHFERDDAREFVFLLFEQRGGRCHELRAFCKRFASMMRERLFGALETLLDFVIAESGKFFQLFAGCRIDRRDCHCRSYNRRPFGIKTRSSKSKSHCTSSASTAAGMAPCKIVT